MTTILLVRHGQTAWNREERFRGQVDLPLDDLGLRQADLVGRRIACQWQPAAIYDGEGRIVDTLHMQHTPDRTPQDRRAHYYCTRADVWGDSREEAILFGSRGACIYANARPLALPTLYNNTLYPGM